MSGGNLPSDGAKGNRAESPPYIAREWRFNKSSIRVGAVLPH